MKQIKYALIFAAAFILAGCDRATDENSPVTTSESEADELPESDEGSTPEPTRSIFGDTTILADGLLVAANPALALSFQTNGRLLTVEVAAGDQVEAGDLIATLDDQVLQETVASAELALAQAETGQAQAQLSLDNLANWEPDEMVVTVAEANLEAAEARSEAALTQDAAAGNSVTSARIGLDQAHRALNDIQEAYDKAWEEARDWELNYNEPICFTGQGGPIPCTGPTWKERIENERDGTSRGLIHGQESLAIARANYNLALAGTSTSSALDADLAILNAQQALSQAQTGPKDSELEAAQLQVTQAELSVQQAENSLEQAKNALEKANLFAPWSGTVVSVDVAPGTFVGAGTPIIIVLDTENLQFHTVNLSERDLAHIAPGQRAEITLKSHPGEPISGSVVYIAPLASGQVGDAATFTVVIDPESNELSLMPGMTGRVDIQREAK
jgi:HlyD family secretion protein